ncbi:MAG: deoxyribonuclease [Candidatus Cloacimonetes bacterium 4572_65]|nr:MAG: deoxyribonuclease [Candidatus Cloacimonetes bacterium 4572_65]
MPNIISEDDIERNATKLLLDELRYSKAINCYTSDPNNLNDKSNRESKKDVVFKDRILSALKKINPNVSDEVLDRALTEITRKRTMMSAARANKEISILLKDGITLEQENSRGKKEPIRIKFIDYDNTDKNEFLIVTQLWIQGERGFRRPDIILYINGFPLVFIELKNSNVKVEQGYTKNLTDYKNDIPQLFWHNSFCVISNAIETKVGSFTAGWEHFFKWLRINDEKEKVNLEEVKSRGTSLEFLLRGLCNKDRLLDYIENFTFFHGEDTKIVAQNHQFLGVNKAIESFKDRENRDGKLGVFWHTQGSGKSFSMAFLYRKIMRKEGGDFSFVIITDRNDLDGQIYKNFVKSGVITKNDAATPSNGKKLREALAKNKKIVFTLIQKFRYDKGKTFPCLTDEESDREVIVIVDEAHRTQYADLADNLRLALPKAHFFAFTGTPLLGKNRKTNKWFGSYVSEYNFSQAIDDEATLPLYYENRVPEVEIQNDNLNEEFYEIIEDGDLDDDQMSKLSTKFSSEYEAITRDSRLDIIAKDIVDHFPNRGYLGKAMVISIDKFTSVKMYNKVQFYWKKKLQELTGLRSSTTDELERSRIKKQIAYMKSIDMAVVLSEGSDDDERFKKEGLEIKPHRDKLNTVDLNGHDIEYRFKDPQDKLQLCFVCAMWLTGFDASTISTLYIDKPMKDHTLMQTIARANRVSSYKVEGVTKSNGEVIDYYNIFRNMEKALGAYGGGDDIKPPIEDKEYLFKLLDDSITLGIEYCKSINVPIEIVLEENEVFKNIALFESFADKIMKNDETKREFIVYANTIYTLYQACKPDILKDLPPMVPVFQYLKGLIQSITGDGDPIAAIEEITELLDRSVVANEHSYTIPEGGKRKRINLGQLNIDELREKFKATPYKNITITDMRAFIQDKIQKLLNRNRNRVNFVEKYQEMIDKYNAGAMSTELFFEELLEFMKDINKEEERHIKEGLSEDELELYDTLLKDNLTKEETQAVKLAAKDLLKRLVEEQPKVLVQDWFKDSQSKEIVKSKVEEVLHTDLPDSYDRIAFKNKCEEVFNLVYDYSIQGKKWAA